MYLADRCFTGEVGIPRLTVIGVRAHGLQQVIRLYRSECNEIFGQHQPQLRRLSGEVSFIFVHGRMKCRPPRESRYSNENKPIDRKKVNSVEKREPISRAHVFVMAPPRSLSNLGSTLTVQAQASLLKRP